ncbi:Gag-Pol polyprotein [Vitis vinifera]|uniref:Gag-Pol polyprotein n=1 Tax=Vitis vinifera TaxID=29760 RepID=A0A438GM08_VITVI|nr:Gag-Pol polyprotein [Vitis vinifera]
MNLLIFIVEIFLFPIDAWMLANQHLGSRPDLSFSDAPTSFIVHFRLSLSVERWRAFTIKKPPGNARKCMCGGDDHLAWKHPVSLEACRGLRTVGGIDGQQAQQVPVQEDTQFDTTVPPPLRTVSQHHRLYLSLHSQTEVAPPPAIVPTPISEDPHARMDKLEQKLRQMRTSEGAITWEDFDGAPVASLPAKFRMPEIERYTGIGCPRIHLRLYSTVMRAHGLDDAQMVMLFPMSLSGAAQRWRELEALRQRPEESVTSFISRWREKISQIIDRPSERDQISMIMRSLQPRFARHLMGFPHTDFGSLVQALYGIEEGIARGLWSESSPTDSKGKRPSGGQRSGDVGAISSVGMRPSRHYQTVGQTPGYYYPPSPHAHYRPPAPSRPMTPTYLHPVSQPVFAAHVVERPPAPYIDPELHRPLLMCRGHHVSLLSWGPGHDTDHCTALRHAIQDLNRSGLVNLGQPSVTTNPLPAHSTHAMQPSSGDIHHMDLIEDDSIHMLSWDDGLPEPIVLHDSYEIDGFHWSLRLLHHSVDPGRGTIPVDSSYTLSYRMSGYFFPFTLWPEDDDSEGERYRLSAVETTTTPEGLIHMMTAGRATCIVFSDDDLPPDGLDPPTAIALGFAPSDFGPSTQTVRAYDSTKREVMGRPWIHVAGAIPSSLHQKVKFIHDGQVITVRSTGIYLRLLSQYFRSVTRLVAMSFDQHSSTVVLDMMRGMTFLPGMGLGRRQQGPSEFIAAIDHDTTFGLGFIPTEARLPSHGAAAQGEGFEGTQTLPVPELPEDDSSLFEGIVSPVEGASDVVDPPLSFDVLSGFVSRSDDVSVASFMDLSILNERVSPAAGDVETVDFGTEDQPRELKIGSPLSTDERDRLIHLLRSYLDVFAWSYEDMPGLDPFIVQHHLPTLPHARPVKQKLRRLHPRWSLQVKEEIQKQLSVGFISVVEYPEWLANVVPVPKKDGKVRVCVDFRDLNKATLKMTFLFHTLICWLMAPQAIRCCLSWMGFQGATYQRAATTLFHDMMHRDVEVYVDDMIVKSREVDPDKIKAILDMPAPKTEKEIRGRTSQQFGMMTVSLHLRRSKEYLLSPPVLVPPTPGRPLLLYLSVSDMALGYLQLTGRLMRWLVLLTEFDIQYVSQKSIKGSIVADHLASLPTSEDRPVDDDFPDEEFVAMTSLIRMGDHIPRSVRLAFSDRHPATNNIVEYEACILGLETALELDIRQMEVFGDSNLSAEPIADALATLASSVDIPIDVVIRPLLIESRSAPAYCCLIGEIEDQDDLPWYHDIYQFLRSGTYPEVATTKDRRALRHLATRFVICGDTLYRRSADGMLLLCLDRASADRVMREVHSGVCGPHMGGHMLARKIMRTGYFWLTMETDCCQFVQKCPECQIHGDLIHAPPSDGHEFILVAIDYFTKWVEAASYARLTSARVASFIRSHIICRYGVPHELISDRGAHFRAEVDTLLQEYGIRHHRSSAYRPQTNGAVEAANKNIKRILRKMVETSRDWSEKLPFALWAYRTSFRTSTGATPYSLVYGMEAVLPVETEMGSLRVALEQQISETEWAQARFDQLNLLDERRLRAADHVQAYQRKMARAFKKRLSLDHCKKGT